MLFKVIIVEVNLLLVFIISSELNIKKLWRIYNAEAQDSLKVKESYFRYVFCTNFNIEFGTPSADACSTCISFEEKIKHSNNCDTD